MTYDSADDTRQHIENVRRFTAVIAERLIERGKNHDTSKLQSPEKEAFDNAPPIFSLTYESEEYKTARHNLRDALAHHYEHNTHHPEHFENGIDGMTLLDLIEMFCDWKASVSRLADGDMEKSIAINKERFGMSDQLHAIFINTANRIK